MAEPIADTNPQDVADRWRPLTPTEQATAEALIQDASAMLRAQYPGIDDQIATGQLDPDIATWAVCTMVKTAMIGATISAGASQVSSTTGPYSSSATYTNPTGNLYITAAIDQTMRGYRPRAVSMRYAT